VRCRSWPRSAFSDIIAINNAWRIRDDWDYLIAPDDFPSDRRPPTLRPSQRFVGSTEYVPANNRFGGVFYAGGTMAFTTGYWALHALQPSVLAFVGCDMVYAASGKTHFYGSGEPDPLRDDLSLRSLEAKSARLMLHAAEQGCACVRLSTQESRLVFPSMAVEELSEAVPLTVPETPEPLFGMAKVEEDRLGYRHGSGRYWEIAEEFCADRIDALDALWLRAARATTKA
jgi:hypothetical protein